MFDFYLKRFKRPLLYFFIGLLIYFPLFGWMDWMPLRIFDEGRNAVNAIEMFWSKNYLVTKFEGAPDYWNTKPPLMFWVQILFLKLLGLNELSIRMPIALFTLATCTYMYWFAKEYLRNEELGLISVLILMTSMGYVNYHGSRSGDFDTLLTFFLLINACSFFLYLERREHKHFLVFFISWIFACYSKGIVGMMFLPAYFIYTLWTKSFFIFKNKYLYIYGVFSLTIVLSYFFIRELYDPGYIDAVNKIDLTGRFIGVVDGHLHPWHFYLTHLVQHKFFPWIYFLIFSILYSDSSEQSLHSRFIKFAFLVCFTFFIFISVSNTKLIWYDMPIYPLISLISALGVYSWYEKIRRKERMRSILFIILLFIFPYYSMFKTIYVPRVSSEETPIYLFANYVKDHKERLLHYPNLHIQWSGYHASNLFYTYCLKSEDSTVRYNQRILTGDHLVMYEVDRISQLKKEFSLKPILQENGISVFKVL